MLVDDKPAKLPDWSRETKGFFEWNPSRSLIASIRMYQEFSGSNGVLNILRKNIAVLLHRFWSIVTGADIPLTTQLGGGLLIPHPNGVVIHPAAVIGMNCLIFQQVTIGTANNIGPPVIGNNVDIGAGAKVLGKLEIGDGAKIGANAVVLSSVPSGATAVGIPARVLGKS